MKKKLNRKDFIIICAVTVLYAVLAFINLGDMHAPQTKPAAADRLALMRFADTESIDEIIYYKGLGDGEIAVYTSEDGEEWELCDSFETGNVFAWNKLDCAPVTQYLGISVSGEADIYEFGIRNISGENVTVPNNSHEWFDEQDMLPDKISYKNSTYFDEIYHVRTAYEHLHGAEPYEITHPPLGKILIAIGIKIFGMTPFGWRFMGTLFGIMMLPLMYAFAKRIFGNSFIAAAAMLLMTFDFMHFTQTRIATIDSFAVFFIMLMYYFMYIYYDSTSEELPMGRALGVLALCGFSFALGVSTKWICIYAGAGLAVLFTLATVRREKEKNGQWLKICLYCIGFFIAVPLLVYFLSYIPYYIADKSQSPLSILIVNQKYMISYHGHLVDEHPFKSPWYEWPIVKRPIWFYGATDRVADGMVSSIVSFGNPLIWWCCSAAMVYLIVTKMKNRKMRFLVIAFLSQFLPWVLVPRSMFIYHFFASVPFIMLALSAVFDEICMKFKWGRKAVVSFLSVSALLFIIFYPILSGMTVSRGYVNNFLKWFKSWDISY